jgi:hypothetical protein
MASAQFCDRLIYYLGLWVRRFVINLLKFSLLSTLIGVLVFALIIADAFMTTGNGSISPGAGLIQWALQRSNAILLSRSEGDFEGISAMGQVVLAFAAPYLTAINIVVSIAETLTDRNLFRWLQWSIQSRLKVTLALFGLLMVLSVSASNVPATELPYWIRIVFLSFLAGWAIIVLLLLHRVSLNAETTFRRYRDRTLSQ